MPNETSFKIVPQVVAHVFREINVLALLLLFLSVKISSLSFSTLPIKAQ